VPRVLRVLVLAALMVLTVPGVLQVVGAAGQQSTSSQQPKATQPPTFRSSVDLVHVDVVVVDKDGQPVKDLPQNAFTVKDRGKTQSVATFEEIGREAIRADEGAPALPSVRIDVANNQSVQSDRLVIMVVDDLHIWKGRTDRAKQIARDVVNKLGPESSMAVLFTSSSDHNTIVTADRSVLLSAVDTLKARQSWRRPHPAEDNQRGVRVDPEADTVARGGVLDQLSDAGKVTAQDFFDNMQQYYTLRNAARMLGTLDVRRKAFVMLSEGIGKDLTGLFPSTTLEGDVPQGGLAYASGNVDAFAASSLATVPQLHALALLEMMESLRRANVATYMIDPRGEVKAGDLSAECFPAPSAGNDPCVDDSAGPNDWMSPVRQAQHGLTETAVATGGFAITNTNDFTGGLSKILVDLDHYYLLGFYPTDPNGKGYRPLTVQVAGHPDWILRYRRGYMGGPAGPAPNANADPMLTLSSSILPDPDLPLRLTAIPSPGPSGTSRVTLGLEVTAPTSSLKESDGKYRDTLKYEILVVDDKKAKVRSIGGLEGKLTLSPRAGAETPPKTVTYAILRDVDVVPGHFEFRVSATSAKLSKGGSAYLGVDVPNFKSAPIVIGGLLIGYQDGARVPIAPPPTPGQTQPAPTGIARGRGPAPAPPPPAALMPDLPFPPTLDRAFSTSDTLRVYAQGAAHVNGGLSADIEILDADARVVSSSVSTVTAGDPIQVSGVVPLKNLAPGPYLMRVTVSGGGQKAEREVGFLVR
jgi:VWFA-related protein